MFRSRSLSTRNWADKFTQLSTYVLIERAAQLATPRKHETRGNILRVFFDQVRPKPDTMSSVPQDFLQNPRGRARKKWLQGV